MNSAHPIKFKVHNVGWSFSLKDLYVYQWPTPKEDLQLKASGRIRVFFFTLWFYLKSLGLFFSGKQAQQCRY